MTTGWGEAFSNARKLESDGETPARDQTAIAAEHASDAFDAPASNGAMCLYGRLPEWPEAAVYVYI
jgi:hypothetical protein